MKRKQVFLTALAILFLAVLSRSIFLIGDDVPFLFSDSGTYLAESRSFAPNFSRPLGYSVFLSIVLAIRHDLTFVVYVQSLLGALTIVGFAFLGRRYVFTSWVGLVVFSVLAAFDLRLIVYEHYILSEALTVTMLLPFFYFYFRVVETGRRDFAFYAGLCVGLTSLVRSALYFCIPLGIVVFFFKALRKDPEGEFSFRTAVLASVLFVLGAALPLGSYGLYNKSQTGNFAITHFDGYSLWSAAGHPDICAHEPRTVAKEILCGHEDAHVERLRGFRQIWADESAVAELERHFSKKEVNEALRRLALESILLHPLQYASEFCVRVGDLFVGADNYWRRKRAVLKTAAARQVSFQFGSEHPSLHAEDAPIWKRWKGALRVSALCGGILAVATLLLFFGRFRGQYNIVLITWVWGYVLACSAVSPSDSRYYVVVLLPLLLVVARFVESVVPGPASREPR